MEVVKQVACGAIAWAYFHMQASLGPDNRWTYMARAPQGSCTYMGMPEARWLELISSECGAWDWLVPGSGRDDLSGRVPIGVLRAIPAKFKVGRSRVQ